MSDRTKTAIVHVETQRSDREAFRDSESRLNEAIGLAEAIDLDVVFSRVLNLKKKDAGRLIGSGHVDEIREVAEKQDIELVVINHPLSPIQQRNLEMQLQLKVIDRTGLILEIFGERAATREGRWQVDAAHLKYQKSRLVRSWTHLERQRGGRGFLGGPGETQIEADRRALDVQIEAIERRLEDIRRTRGLHRTNRKRNATPVIALVGYTNAGKSTLFNRICDEKVMAKDMLFATLDPVMRNVELPSGREIVLSDTVGFISDLPTELVVAFRATLEEVEFADIILHVRDASHSEHVAQARDVWSVLEAIGVDKEGHSPKIIEVFNKIDQVDDGEWLHDQFDAVKLSALTGEGLEALYDHIERALNANFESCSMTLKFGDAAARAWLHEQNIVKDELIDSDGVHLELYWDTSHRNKFRKNYRVLADRVLGPEPVRDD